MRKALRLELPGRSTAQIASILYHRLGVQVSERMVRGQLRHAELHREALATEPKTFGRYEVAVPNERWITDVLVGPWVPHPKWEGSVRARLFLMVDDHSPCWPAAGSSVARSCCARRSPAAACGRCSTVTTGRPFERVAGPDLCGARDQAGAFEAVLVRAGDDAYPRRYP